MPLHTKRSLSLSSLLVLTLSLGTPAALGQTQDIVETAVSSGTFTTLVAALGAADLVSTLQGDGPFTVFAPSDEAFAKIPAGLREALLQPEARDELTAILTYHVIAGRRVPLERLVAADGTETVGGRPLRIRQDRRDVLVDDAKVTATVACTNGVIHVIDTVLVPNLGVLVSAGAKAGQLSLLQAALQAADLDEVLASEGPITILAPTDEAFGRVPEQTLQRLLQPQNRELLGVILKYHVVPGRVSAVKALAAGKASTVQGDPVRFGLSAGRLQVNDANVIVNDLRAANGVIHLIDAVLMPPDAPQPRAQGRLVIGINYGRPSSEQRMMLGLGSGEGITVTNVSSRGAAKDAGLLKGDIIVSINGAPATLERLSQAKGEAGAGGTLDMVIARKVEVEVRSASH